MRIWDVRRLKRPRYLGFYEGNEASVDHNLYVKDDLIYQANYSSGLRVVRMQESSGKDSSLQLEEVAYIDTYPQRKNAEIQAGAWSAYPYFDDKLIVGDTLNGLFVAKLSFPKV